MAHVQFRVGDATTNGAIAELVVDGVDITKHVLARGFSISPTTGDAGEEWTVNLVLAAGSLDIDLPDAVLRSVVDDGAAR